MSRTFLAPIPVVPVLFMLGHAPDHRGRYFCPFHDDNRPGGKPSAEVRDDPTVLSCWSCGEEATAPMLVAALTNVSLEEGLTYALSVAGTTSPVAKKRKPAPTAARLEEELKRQTTDIRYPNEIDPVAAFIAARGWPAEIGDYAKREWGWAGDYHGRVVQPHRNASGHVTGMRWRLPPNWEKDGRKGSAFKQLYGIWRLGVPGTTEEMRADLSAPQELSFGHDSAPRVVQDEVWLMEGETDSVWAGYHLEPLGVGVAGVVTAQYKPRQLELSMLVGRTVVLVFDSDSAGEGCRTRWANALLDVTPTVKHLRLDEGKDLCTTEESPEELRRLIWK